MTIYFQPVSYTHLDVYKRQHHHILHRTGGITEITEIAEQTRIFVICRNGQPRDGHKDEEESFSKVNIALSS